MFVRAPRRPWVMDWPLDGRGVRPWDAVHPLLEVFALVGSAPRIVGVVRVVSPRGVFAPVRCALGYYYVPSVLVS